jgi:hypothetical protein
MCTYRRWLRVPQTAGTVRKTFAMAQLVVRLADNSYVLWSDTVDAPVTPVLGRTAIISFLESEHHVTWEAADSLVRTADESATSDPTRNLSEVVDQNRAGPGESNLSLDELISAYSG